MFNTYEQWCEEAFRRGAEVENNGANRLIAHINGAEIGEYDPSYGGFGTGWFY